MLVEGMGTIAPAPVRIGLSRTELRILRDIAEQRNVYRGYARRADAWGRGFIKNPALVGLVGEHAVCKFLTCRGFQRFADTALRPTGDGGRDIEVMGLVLQVKTRRNGIGRRSLVKRGDRGRIVPLSCDVFVFVQWAEESPDEAQLLGWLWAKDASRTASFERSPIPDATHWNLKIPDVLLLPMSRLGDELVARRVCA